MTSIETIVEDLKNFAPEELEAIANNIGEKGATGEAGAQGVQGLKGEDSSPYGCTGSNLGECKVFITTSKFTGNLQATAEEFFDALSTSSDNFINDACSLPNTSASTALDKANCICAIEGAKYSEGRWRAWLSTSSTSALENINYNPGATYIRVSDSGVIATAGTLMSGDLSNPISASGGTIVNTGTLGNGLVSSGQTCSDWTSTDGTVTRGGSSATDSTWTNNTSGIASCLAVNPIYCFEAASSAIYNPA